MEQYRDARSYADEKLSQITLEEKVLLLCGKDMWRTNHVPRVGIPSLKFSDGPVGVRGSTFVDGLGAASLPMGVSLAAAWDKKVIENVCEILVSEAKSKGAGVLLGPTVCLPRTPLGGRNYESYSENPFLTGQLAATFINSLQSGGIGACIKHFAANDQETRRFFIDEKIPERALREIACQPFQIAIRESNPWTVMTAYNQVNGQFCSSNHHLLRDILRGEWGWDGLVMSDWFGTNSVVPALKASLDLEMPGPVRRRGKFLLQAYQEGLVNTADIDESTRRVLELIHKCGKSSLGNVEEPPEEAVDLPQHREILRKAAEEGIVLLKNESNILPLQNLDGTTVAFIGPNAARSVATGGGSANLKAHYRTTPLDSFTKLATSKYPSVQIQTEPGIICHRYLPLIDPAIMRNPDDNSSGFSLSFWNNRNHSGTALAVDSRPSSNLVCYDTLPEELTTGERYSYRARTILTPRTTGLHQFSLSSCGPGRLLLDGNVIIDIPRRWWSPKSSLFMSYGSPEERVSIHMEAGREYEVVLDSISREPRPYEMTLTGMLEREEIQDGGRIGFFEYVDEDELFSKACALAKSSDITILVVGKDDERETEMSDMVSMDLPLRSNELIAAIAKQTTNLVLVSQTGSPINMPWVDDMSTVVQAWYQGQEQGSSLANVLLGDVNPSGKLPVTFPRRLEDNPSHGFYPGENDVVHYGEGIFAGYRHYDYHQIEPLFPFGFGLSYTQFEYSNIRCSTDRFDGDENGQGATISVEVDVKNIGDRVGKEIVQFYVKQVTIPKLPRPPQELKGWDKVTVAPGQTVTARAILDRVSLSYFDDTIGKWSIDGNATFQVLAAQSSRDKEALCATFVTTKKAQWIH